MAIAIHVASWWMLQFNELKRGLRWCSNPHGRRTVYLLDRSNLRVRSPLKIVYRPHLPPFRKYDAYSTYWMWHLITHIICHIDELRKSGNNSYYILVRKQTSLSLISFDPKNTNSSLNYNQYVSLIISCIVNSVQ